MKIPNGGWRVSDIKQLPPTIANYLSSDSEDADDYIEGGILNNLNIAWLSNGSKFTVINLSTRQKIASWTFGAILRDLKAHITCVCEIPPLIDNTIQLLVGLECELVGGMICLLHCNGSYVIRAIQVDCRVTSLHYVNKLRGVLNCFDGAVIIGTHGGATLIFDLDRDACRRGIRQVCQGNSHLLKNELNLANLVVLSIDDIALIEEQRLIACQKEEHIAIHINEGCIHQLQFVLHNPNHSVQLEMPREHVLVTSILYIEQLGSVVIAFNIGAFQIWNLKNLSLEYTSHMYHEHLAISHLGFLEPCDDPRAFCYLWVIYSPLEKHCEGFPLATMYALTYRGKKSLDSNYLLYEDFLTCTLRFNIELSAIDGHNLKGKQIIGGRGITCHTISQTIQDNEGDDRIINICQVVWECWSESVITPIYSAMLVFDIDQWYKEQMPDCSVLETNSYMSVVNISGDISNASIKNICDVRINPTSLSPYMVVQRLEEHFYPNALNFDCMCLSDCDITQFTATGIQNEILQTISKSGPSILLNPTKIFQQCISSGLIPLYSEVNSDVTVAQQRQFILSVALEANMVRFLLKCGTDWANDSFASSECSLKFLIEWCWSRSMILKMNGDQLTVPLFDHSGESLDSNTSRCFNSCTVQLSDITKFLSLLLEKCSQHVLPETIYEIKQRQRAIQMVALYFQVIQWFLDVGLLPEFVSERDTLEKHDKLPYPLESLTNFYQNRRLKLHRLNGEASVDVEIQNRHCDFLFIDQYIKKECGNEFLTILWKEENSSLNGLYPPPSLYALLKTYLIPNIDDEHKHSLILYMLIDYAMMFNDAWYEIIIRRLMQFPIVFGLKNSTIKVTQAFWHLDHKDFEFASVQLHHVLANDCLVQWQHEVALSAFSLQKKTQLALQYLHVRKACSMNKQISDTWEDWEVSCNLYLSRDLIVQAFELIKGTFSEWTSGEIKKQRLLTFFDACRKQGSLSKVSSLPFSQEEENIFVKYLINIGDIDSCNLLIAYYLERSRYIEARQVNEDLKILTSKGQLPYDLTSDFTMKKQQHTHKTKTRDQLVEMYCKTLPKITRHLSQFATGRNEVQKGVMPTPLTVNVQEITNKTISYKSSVIQATIDKVNETWLEKPSIARGVKRALQVEDTPFICTPKLRKLANRCDDFEMVTIQQSQNTEASEPIPETTTSKDKTISPKLQQEMELLLHTPVIEKRTNWPSDVSTGQFSLDRYSIRTATPQSILKVKKMLGNIDEHHLAETDDELETMSQHTQSDLSRSIRFNIPTTSNSPSPSSICENQELMEELLSYEAKKSRSPISPRKGIHDTCSSDIHTSPTSTPVKKTPIKRQKLMETLKTDFSMEQSKDISQLKDILPAQTVEENLFDDKSLTSQNPTITIDENAEKINSPKLSSYSPKGRKSYRQDVDLYYTSTPTSKKNISSNISAIDSELSLAHSPKVSTPLKQKSSLTRKVLEASILAKIPESEDNVSTSSTISHSVSVKESSVKEYLTRSKSRLLSQTYSNDSILTSDMSEEAISEVSGIHMTREEIQTPVQKYESSILAKDDDEKSNQSSASSTSTPSLTIDEVFEKEDEIESAALPSTDAIPTESQISTDHSISENPTLKEDETKSEEEYSEHHNVPVESEKECETKLKDDIIHTENIDTIECTTNIEMSTTSAEQDDSEFMENVKVDLPSHRISLNMSLMTEEESILEDTQTSIDNSKPADISSDVQNIHVSTEIDNTNKAVSSETVNVDENIILHFDDDTQSSQESTTSEDNKLQIDDDIGKECAPHEVITEEEKKSDPSVSSEIVLDKTSSSEITSESSAKDESEIIKTQSPVSLDRKSVITHTETPIKKTEPIINPDSKTENILTAEINPEIESDKNISLPKVQLSATIQKDDDVNISQTTRNVTTESMDTTNTENETIIENKSTVTSEDQSSESKLEADKKTKVESPKSKKSPDQQSQTSKKNITITPTRITRSISKIIKEIINEDEDEEKAEIEQKPSGRRTISTKPNLSVISEVSHIEDTVKEESAVEESMSIAEKYSLHRRLTRHQKSILEKSFDNLSPKTMICSNIETERVNTPKRGHSKKTRSEPCASPSRKFSFDLDVSASKIPDTPTKAVPSAKLLDESITHSPSGRPRRKSFNKAVEALSTPKRQRRTSTDSRNEDDNASVGSSIEDKSIGKDIRHIPSKLLTIDESEQELNEMPTTSKSKPGKGTKRIRKKAASVHGDIVSQTDLESPLRTRGRVTQIVTPLSKEEQLQIDSDNKSKYRRKTRTSSISQPIKFVVKKD